MLILISKERLISVSDPCTALCKGLQKVYEVLEAEIWKRS